MVQIVGKYEHERSENLEEYLKTVVGEEHADKAATFAQSKPVLEVGNNGDDYTITVSNDGKSNTTTFQLGVPYDETMPHGVTMKSLTTQEGDKFTTKTELPNGNKSVRVYEFTENGITVHLSDENTGAKGTRYYKRM
ncbi:fatty acid-binding protein homolog 9-like [Leptopilina heterotoma]|uniref:fatty acid-binding protein homolog 9-like n=1 Tax=Leptopilina heterotoma TaxID=63436 RepID=UPI001CA91815|nr:fatty acid-binding protein homolog 9-like [Leptopilina heterotoma]